MAASFIQCYREQGNVNQAGIVHKWDISVGGIVISVRRLDDQTLKENGGPLRRQRKTVPAQAFARS
jgi:hypothetical protein